MAKSFAWSYSVLDSFETCPRRHYLTKVSKEVVEPQSEAMEWGNRVHKALEMRVKINQPLPTGMEQWEPIAASLINSAKGGDIEAEQKLACTVDYQPTTYFAKNCWVRGITDVTVTKGDKALIADYKTGNPNPESAQLRLTAAMTMSHKPWVKTVHNSFIWLKTGEVSKETFTRDQLPELWGGFLPRVQRLQIALEENKFPPKPSGLCRKWCPVPQSKCEYRGV